MDFRIYRPQDCTKMIRLFYDTVHSVNRKDYSKMQTDAWAPKELILTNQMEESWNRSFLEHYTVVAEEDGILTGFGDIDYGDIDTGGYLDRLYVHKDYQGRGIASAICDRLERHCAGMVITTHASITAKPFFEKRGYRTVKEQQVERRGVILTNFVMTVQSPEAPISS